MSWTLSLGLPVAGIILVVATADVLLTVLARLGYWPAWATPRALADIGTDAWRPAYSGEFAALRCRDLVLVIHRDQTPDAAHADLMRAAPDRPGFVASNHRLPAGGSLHEVTADAIRWAEAVVADPRHPDRYVHPVPGGAS